MNNRSTTRTFKTTLLQQKIVRALTLLIDKVRIGGISYDEACAHLDFIPKPARGEILISTKKSDYEEYGLTPEEFCNALRVLREKEGLLKTDPIPREYEAELVQAEEKGYTPNIWLPGNFFVAIDATGDFIEKAEKMINRSRAFVWENNKLSAFDSSADFSRAKVQQLIIKQLVITYLNDENDSIENKVLESCITGTNRTATLHTHIAKIRKKLNEAFGDKIQIGNIDHGYKFTIKN